MCTYARNSVKNETTGRLTGENIVGKRVVEANCGRIVFCFVRVLSARALERFESPTRLRELVVITIMIRAYALPSPVQCASAPTDEQHNGLEHERAAAAAHFRRVGINSALPRVHVPVFCKCIVD